jgi:hypothetical protein
MSLGGASSTGSLGCEAPVSGVGPRPAEAGIDRGLVPGAKANARAWLVAGEGIAVGRIGVPCRLPDIHQVRGTAALGTGIQRILYFFRQVLRCQTTVRHPLPNGRVCVCQL